MPFWDTERGRREDWSSDSYETSSGEDENNDSDSSDRSFSSADNDDDDEMSSSEASSNGDTATNGAPLITFHNSPLRRRRRHANDNDNDNDDDDNNKNDIEEVARKHPTLYVLPETPQSKREYYRKHRRQCLDVLLDLLFPKILRRKLRRFGCTLSRCSTCFLLLALVFWILVQLLFSSSSSSWRSTQNSPWWLESTVSQHDRDYAESVRNRILPPKDRSGRWRKESSTSMNHNNNNNNNNVGFWGIRKRNKKKSVEDLPPDCSYKKWQLQAFPNCNDLHEMDLKSMLRFPSSRHRRRQHNTTTATTDHNGTTTYGGKYISSGLWRDVWSLAPRRDEELVVLKMMKPGTIQQTMGTKRTRVFLCVFVCFRFL